MSINFENLTPEEWVEVVQQIKDGFSKLEDYDRAQCLEELEQFNHIVETTYVPHTKQKLFHTAPNKVRAVFGGNRSGKTEVGVNEARFHATGKYPSWYPESGRFGGPTRGRIVVTDFKVGAREVLEPKLKRWFGDDILKIERSVGNISKVHVRHITGGVSTFDVMTHEQDNMQFEGWSGHWVWFDEPPPRDKYVACLRGTVDFSGRLWITATPITEPWLFDEIITNEKRDAWHTVISIYDNPYLKAKDIEEFLVSLTPEEIEARRDGKFLHLSGRVYSEFDSSVHIIQQLPKGHESWPVYFVLDPADRRPHHGIWAKVDPLGTFYVFDEFVYKGTVGPTAREIIVRERTNGINPENVIRLLDPNKGRTPSISSGMVLSQEFGAHGLGFDVKINDDLATGHLAVKGRLHYDKSQPLSTFNAPKLYFVGPKTKECVKQLLSYVWDDWRGRNNASRSQKEQPKDINKDMPDCVRYLCVKNPIYGLERPKVSFLDVDDLYSPSFQPTPRQGPSKLNFKN